MHSSSTRSSPSKSNPLNNLSNTLRRFSWNRPKSEVGPFPPPVPLRQMHQQHHSEDNENQVELQVIDEIQSGAASRKSTPSHSFITSNENQSQQVISNNEYGKGILLI